MRPWQGLKNALGCSAVAAMLLLSSPGVRLVRAGEAGPAADPEALTCREPEEVNAQIFARVQALRRSTPSRVVDAGEIVVLNGRGHNYPSPGIAPRLRPDPDPR